MKQTAVEWLVKQFESYDSYQIELLHNEINKAKEMEKEQIIEAGNSCALKQYLHINKINKMSESEIRQFAEEEHLNFGEKHYKETFNK
jgi:hypothetical protein